MLTPQACLQNIPGFPRAYTLAAVPTGTCNRTYRVRITNPFRHETIFALRIHSEQLNMVSNRKKELHLWHKVAQHRWAPAPIHVDEQFRFILSAWVHGINSPHLTLEDWVRLCLQLHTIEYRGERMNYAERIALYENTTQYSNRTASVCNGQHEPIHTLCSHLAHSVLPWGFVHHDLSPNNIVDTTCHRDNEPRHFVVLDFEYAGRGHAYMDLAMAGSYLGSGATDTLWRAYLQARGVSATEAEGAAWRAAKKIMALLVLSWTARFAEDGLENEQRRWAHVF